MKIIKQGSLEKPNIVKRFECKNCGTVFECDRGEWKETDGHYGAEVPYSHCPLCGQVTQDVIIGGNRVRKGILKVEFVDGYLGCGYCPMCGENGCILIDRYEPHADDETNPFEGLCPLEETE